jgi:hypothetical protein
MIGAREIVYSLYGAYRLCRFDPQGLAFFNPTLEGFWRSFVAALIVAPAHCILTIINLRDVELEASLARVVAIETLAYVILVFAYPLVVFHICQMMGRSERYFTYIVAYNWAGVIQISLILPATALGASDLLPLNLAYAIGLAVTLLVLVMLWYIARLTLQIGGLAAAGFVLLDLLLGLLVRAIADGRLGVG